jgi:heat shock protein HslJ
MLRRDGCFAMKRLLPAALALLAACAPFPPAPPAPYHGVGTEPFWSLIIDDRNVTFILSGEQPIVQPRPKAIVAIAGEIYQTPRINVNIVHARCSDGMSDRVYPDTLQVTVDGKRFNGCGGL